MVTSTANLDPNQVAKKEVKADGRKIRIGIIGTGGIAHSHMQSYLRMPDVEIVAVSDIIPGKAATFMDHYIKNFGFAGCRCYDSDAEMLKKEKKNLDAVSVCTYNTQHAPCAIRAMEAGLDVLLEKPFTVTVEEAAEIMRVEKKTGKILSIGFQPRMDGNMQEIKRICESGVLGKIYYIQTGGGRRHGIPASRTSFIEKDKGGIGALGDIGCYSLDMVLNAIGYPKPLTVTGYKSDFFGKSKQYYRDQNLPEKCAEMFGVDDFAAAFIRLEGDIILDFRIAWAMNINTPGDTVILGTEGGLRIPSTDCWNGSTGGPMTLYHQVGGLSVETVIPLVKDTSGMSLFDKKIRSFLDAVKDPSKGAPVPSSQILYNQAIIDGIAKSHEKGKEIKIVIPKI